MTPSSLPPALSSLERGNSRPSGSGCYSEIAGRKHGVPLSAVLGFCTPLRGTGGDKDCAPISLQPHHEAIDDTAKGLPILSGAVIQSIRHKQAPFSLAWKPSEKEFARVQKHFDRASNE